MDTSETLLHLAILVASGALAGAVNAVAGGGSFVTFPTLIFLGAPALESNATSSVALWPGAVSGGLAFREELSLERARLRALAPVSLAGGFLGAVILTKTPSRLFEDLVPFLLLAATLMFTFGGRMKRTGDLGMVPAAIIQLVFGLYGGYFGGGFGFLMLALFTAMGMTDVHRMNALKTSLGALMKGAAVAWLAFSGAVLWMEAGALAVGAFGGAYATGRNARRISPGKVRPWIVAAAWVLTALFFWRTYVD